jgi:uncharacterized protein
MNPPRMVTDAAAAAAARAQAMRPRAFSLELTKGCNLRCGYCYYAARDDAYDPRETMSADVAERSIDMLLREGPPGEAVHVHLFGGEPLLNFALLRHAVEYGERRAAECGRAITFEVTTNGTRFSAEVIEFLNAHAVDVGVSFDGPPLVQDAARPALSGSSYDKAAPGIRAFLASRAGTALAAKAHCSVVVTRRELDLVKIVEHLEELGFERIILTPATDLGGHAHGLRMEDLPAVLAAYDALARRCEQRRREGRRATVTWFDNLMGRLLSGERKTEFCQGGMEYLGVAANGDVSLCYRFYENDEFKMGSVQGGIDRGVTERLLSLPLEKRPACGSCWARYFCGGGCHHENLISSGGLGEPNPVTCEILRHTMGRTLETWARLSRDGKVAQRRPVPGAQEGKAMEQTPIGLEDKPKTKPSCHVRAVGNEQVVYEPQAHEVVVLNPTAAIIFALCDGEHTVAAMLAELGKRFAAPADVLQRDLLATLARLQRSGLLQP